MMMATGAAAAEPTLPDEQDQPVIRVAEAQPPAEDTLPPVEVRPDPLTPSLGDGQVSSDFDSMFDDLYSENFPSLSDQILGGGGTDLGGINGVLRMDRSLFDTSQLATIIDREKIQERQATTMFRALQNEVGVTLQQTANGQLSPFIRGLTGQQILILVDGIRVNNSTVRPGPNQYAATFDPGMIERIEVLRGADSVAWGSDAIGGVINIVTRGADPLRGNYNQFSFNEIAATADSSSYSRANVEGWVGGSGVFAGGSFMNVRDVDIGGGMGRQPETNYQQYAGDVKYNMMLDDCTMLTAALQHFEQEDLARSDRFLPFVLGPAPNGSSAIQRPTYFDPQQRDLAYLRLQGVSELENAFYDIYNATVSYSRTKEGTNVTRFNSNAPGAVPTRLEIGEFTDDQIGVTLSAIKDHGALGKFSYGADYYYEDIDASAVRINNPTMPGAMPMPTTPQYPDDSIADRLGAFLLWDVNVTERLNVSTGIRYQYVGLSATPDFETGPLFFERSYEDWIASVGLGYALTEKLKLVGGVYEGFRAPTIDDLTSTKVALQNVQTVPRVGNLNIDPEHSRTYEVGLKYNSDRIRLQAIEWWTDFESYIGREVVSVNGVDTDFLVNQEAYLNGTELAAEYLIDPYWSIYGNFSYVYGKVRDNDDPFSRIPPTQGIVGTRWRDGHSYFDLYTWLVRRQDRYSQFNQGDVRFIPGGTPGYATLNLRAGTALGACNNHRVSIGLENITDKYYRVLGSGVDGTGFNALFGYEFIY